MTEGGFFLPLPTNKLPDFGGAIRDCCKASSIGTEASVIHRAGMPYDTYIMAIQKL